MWQCISSNRDATTNAGTIIDYAHHEVHSGSHYYIEGFTTLGNGAALYVGLWTPDSTKWAHFTWEIKSSGILTTKLWEDAQVSTGGVSVSPINNNRNSIKSSLLSINSAVTVLVSGNVISQASWGSRTGGGAYSREDEIILKQDTVYLRGFISGALSNIVSFKVVWYEHTNKA